MTDDDTITDEIIDAAPDSHPTAEGKLERLDRNRERAQRLVDGKVEVPWPRSSAQIAVIAGLCVGIAGALFTWAYMTDVNTGAFVVPVLVLITAAVALGHYARFTRDHFETGEEPRYVEENDG